ncbi:hypothetical protein AAHC03_04550 [Spirometra sp. Aus1]
MNEPRCDLFLDYSCHKLKVRPQAEPLEIRRPSTHYLKKSNSRSSLKRHLRHNPSTINAKSALKLGHAKVSEATQRPASALPSSTGSRPQFVTE